MKGKYLITTDSWFYAPDGKQYKAVWGEVEIMDDAFLGVKTNKNSSNWFAKVGGENTHVIIAGCQIHYAARCEEPPYTGNVSEFLSDANLGFKDCERPTHVWLAE